MIRLKRRLLIQLLKYLTIKLSEELVKVDKKINKINHKILI